MTEINLRVMAKVVIGAVGLFLIIGGVQGLIKFNPYISLFLGFLVLILSKLL